MKHALLAKSSSGGSYKVVFEISDKDIKVQCNCKAGIFGQLCKHKLALISADESMLYSSEQKEDLLEVIELMNKHDCYEQLSQYATALSAIGKEITKLNKEKKVLKKNFENLLNPKAP